MSPKCVLIVDDDEDSRTICRELLMHHGYHVLESCNGLDGLALASSGKPDLLIVDLRLPDQNGMHLVGLLREQTHTRHLPILLYTADVIGARPYLNADGIAGLITKPCSPTRVLHEVERLIGQSIRLDGANGAR